MRKTHNEFIKEVFNLTGNEYIVLGKYVTSKTKILIKHNCKTCNYNEWEIKPNNFLSLSQRCPVCSKNSSNTKLRNGIDYFKSKVKELTSEEYSVIDNNYVNNKTKVKIIHNKCLTEFEATPNNFISKNSRCPKCSLNVRDDKLRKSIIQVKEEIFNLVGDEYSLLSDTYINNSEKLLFIHNQCGRTFESSLANFIYTSVRCCCISESKGEKAITNFLEEKGLNFIKQYKIKDCKNIKSLPFDFYVPKYNLLIEYQGRQHYMSVEIFGGEEQFKAQQRNDNIKRNYCKNNNIKLLEISYKDFKKINQILTNQINNYDNTVSSLSYVVNN